MQALLGSVLLTLPLIVSGAGCPPCDKSSCPRSCHRPVPDPCHCCPVLCAKGEGEPCSSSMPCDRDYSCQDTIFGKNCVCRLDKRMVCGSNNVTYSSICHMNRENDDDSVSISNWGPCEFGPEIVSGPSEQRAELGQPTALDCEAKGFPIPTLTWIHLGKDGVSRILPGDDQQVAVQVRGGPEQLMVTSWVQIVEARAEDEGYYICEAKSPRGTTSKEATLLVRPYPQ